MNLSPSIAHVFADTLVIAHLAFIIFVLFGALLLLKWPRWMWLHLPCLVWGTLVEFMGWYCPLTPLENHFRELAGLQMYSGDFVMQYIMPVIYPPELSRGFQIVFGTMVLTINGVIYGYLFRRRRIKNDTHN